ncbi:hypothetical protein, partial [Roseomonas chloroacetimidivorans]|uniref:hypothetical protein n=1 Tax=Roseomonas chloroacetimidivorans TaxID=1766656 RepID=UPI003C70BE44
PQPRKDLVFFSVPPGFALIADVRIASDASILNKPPFIVEFEAHDGMRQVRLSPRRFRELGVLDALLTGRPIPIPKP